MNPTLFVGCCECAGRPSGRNLSQRHCLFGIGSNLEGVGNLPELPKSTSANVVYNSLVEGVHLHACGVPCVTLGHEVDLGAPGIRDRNTVNGVHAPECTPLAALARLVNVDVDVDQTQPATRGASSRLAYTGHLCL